MAFHIRDPETDARVRQLARERGCGLTEAVKLAVDNELHRGEAESVRARIAEIQREIAAWPRTGKSADKAFFDEMSGDGA